jgi:hypothetical protein
MQHFVNCSVAGQHIANILMHVQPAQVGHVGAVHIDVGQYRVRALSSHGYREIDCNCRRSHPSFSATHNQLPRSVKARRSLTRPILAHQRSQSIRLVNHLLDTPSSFVIRASFVILISLFVIHFSAIPNTRRANRL